MKKPFLYSNIGVLDSAPDDTGTPGQIRVIVGGILPYKYPYSIPRMFQTVFKKMQRRIWSFSSKWNLDRGVDTQHAGVVEERDNEDPSLYP